MKNEKVTNMDFRFLQFHVFNFRCERLLEQERTAPILRISLLLIKMKQFGNYPGH